MVLEDDVTGSESSPHGRHQNYINIDFCHFLPCLQALHFSLFSDLHIKILMTELLVGVLFCIWTFVCAILGLEVTSNFVELGLGVPDEIYHLALLIYIATVESERVPDQ